MSLCNCTGACMRGEGCSARPSRHRYFPIFDYSPPAFPVMQQGWQCPVCGRVNAPFIAICYGDHSRLAAGAVPEETQR